jgi:hypothetical protein
MGSVENICHVYSNTQSSENFRFSKKVVGKPDRKRDVEEVSE